MDRASDRHLQVGENYSYRIPALLSVHALEDALNVRKQVQMQLYSNKTNILINNICTNILNMKIMMFPKIFEHTKYIHSNLLILNHL